MSISQILFLTVSSLAEPPELLAPGIATMAVSCGMFLFILLSYDESKSHARIERKIKDAPEEWEEIQEVRPKTPTEAKLGCPNARLRTDEPLYMDWGMHVLTDTLIRVEESVRRGAK
ncbi:hypothetical protein MKX03_019935 [Papaver bracteatum]|nr:hypothetical protein MKX03_011812 [Papaver bracteatum]KAI3898233.1 hypothetical protein MKX03_019935 [Papaver bracteatum]